MLKGRHLISPEDFTLGELDEVLTLALDMVKDRTKYSEVCKGKILASLFYEASTRTKFSFEAAMLRMGGGLIGFSDASTSSVSKGESIGDTIKVMSSYCDIMVMRHPREGSAKVASEFSDVPVMNGGDGGHQHPTQTLTDLLTILSLKGQITNQTVAFCGDLKYGRTVHSLITTLSRYEGSKFYLVSPAELKLPQSFKELLIEKYPDIELVETESLEEAIKECSILYMTRIQKERFFNEEDYLKVKNSYILTTELMKLAKEDMIVMHPLPRVNEITYDVDKDPRAAYFKQADYGVYARMALMAKLLGVL